MRNIAILLGVCVSLAGCTSNLTTNAICLTPVGAISLADVTITKGKPEGTVKIIDGSIGEGVTISPQHCVLFHVQKPANAD